MTAAANRGLVTRLYEEGVKGQAIEVNDPGFERVDEVVRRTLGALKPSAIAQMHQYFVEHPEDIPPVSAVRRGSLTRAAKPGELRSRAASAENPIC